MSTCKYFIQRYLCWCCCKPKSLLQHPVTGGDEDWGLNYDEKTKGVRLSREFDRKPKEIETTEASDSFASRNESDGRHSPSKDRSSPALPHSNSNGDIPGEPILMKASADLTPIRGKDGWNKYKATNLNTDDVEEGEVNDNDVGGEDKDLQREESDDRI